MILGLVLLLMVTAPAHAAEPLLTVLKNTILGSATGLLLGGTATLVVDEDSRSDVVRWGVVLGTFGGFGLGVILALRGQEDLFGAAPTEASPAGWASRLRLASAADLQASAYARRAAARQASDRVYGRGFAGRPLIRWHLSG